MNRIHKKCFIGSAILHLLLLVTLLVGAAFLPAPTRPEIEQPFMELIEMPDIIVDANVMGGDGNPVRPNAAPSAPSPAPQREVEQPPAPVQPTPKPTPAKPAEPAQKSEPEPQPEEEDEPENRQETENNFVAEKKPKKIKVNLSDKIKKTVTIAKKSPRDNTQEREREAREREAAEAEDREALAQAEADRRTRLRELARAGTRFSNLRSSFGTGTDINMPGGTGPAYAGYAMVIKKKYDDAWRRPTEGDDSASVMVEIVIARDGRVVSSKIISKSSNSALDKSVKEALDRVRKVPPFPEGAKDSERTFRINYSLKSKTDIG
ncbi:MAG: TonB family protein [Verrucomicrobiales bacterium]